MKITDYELLAASDKDKLTFLVRTKIVDGYKPFESPFVLLIYNSEPKFYQAVIREEDGI
jgi:hypothetical protein